MTAEKKSVEGWKHTTRDGVDTLHRSYTFADWAASIAFVQQLVTIAKAQDHDPLVEISGGSVQVYTWSHDVAGVSDRDVRYATAVNALG